MDPPLRAFRNSHTTLTPHPPASTVVVVRSIVRKQRANAIQEERAELSGRIEFSSSQLQAAREHIQHLKDLQQQHNVGVLTNAKQLQDSMDEQLQDFRIDHQKLVLREVGAQLANKIARRCIPSITTPYAARHITLNRIKTHKGRDEPFLHQLAASFPDLEVGIEALNELVAHLVSTPERMEGEPGADPSITFELLDCLVQTHFDGSDALEPVQQVLACLKVLSKELDEAPFVDTKCP